MNSIRRLTSTIVQISKHTFLDKDRAGHVAKLEFKTHRQLATKQHRIEQF